MFQTKNRRLYGVVVIVVLAVGAIFFSLMRGADKTQSQASSQSQQTQQTQSQSSQNKGYIDSVAADDPYAKGIHHVRIVVKDTALSRQLLTQTLRLLRFLILLILPSQASIMALRSIALLTAS